MTEQADIALKLCIFGEGRVGKTALTQRFITNTFVMDTKMTIGASIFVHYIVVDGTKIALQLWDFGGEEQFKHLLPIYSRGSNGGIFMFDLTRNGTLNQTEAWINTYRQGLDEDEKDLPIILIGGKSDLKEERSVSVDQSLNFKKKFDLADYIECSAKEGENVKEVFENITRKALKHSEIDL